MVRRAETRATLPALIEEAIGLLLSIPTTVGNPSTPQPSPLRDKYLDAALASAGVDEEDSTPKAEYPHLTTSQIPKAIAILTELLRPSKGGDLHQTVPLSYLSSSCDIPITVVSSIVRRFLRCGFVTKGGARGYYQIPPERASLVREWIKAE